MDSRIMKMRIFLDACYAVESAFAGMYKLFAQHFIDDRNLSRLWSEIAMEKENHACHVLLATEMVAGLNLLQLESWQKVTTTLAMIKRFVSSVRESPPSLQDAILMALKCEYLTENLYTQSVVLVKEEPENKMFTAMIQEARLRIGMFETILYEMGAKMNDDIEEIDFEELDCPDSHDYYRESVSLK